MAATNSAEGPVGKHQPFFNHGLSSFFSACAVRSRKSPPPHVPTSPCDPPTAATSTATVLQADYRRPEPPDAPRPCHRVVAGKHASVALASTWPPAHLRRTVFARARR